MITQGLEGSFIIAPAFLDLDPEFKKYLSEGALKPAFATGDEYVKWIEANEQLHKDLMAKGGLLNK